MRSTFVQVLAAPFHYAVAVHSWSNTDRDDSGSYVRLELPGHLLSPAIRPIEIVLEEHWAFAGHTAPA